MCGAHWIRSSTSFWEFCFFLSLFVIWLRARALAICARFTFHPLLLLRVFFHFSFHVMCCKCHTIVFLTINCSAMMRVATWHAYAYNLTIFEQFSFFHSVHNFDVLTHIHFTPTKESNLTIFSSHWIRFLSASPDFVYISRMGANAVILWTANPFIIAHPVVASNTFINLFIWVQRTRYNLSGWFDESHILVSVYRTKEE